MMKKILKNKKLYDKLKYISKKYLYSCSLIILLLVSCQTLPDGYREQLSAGIWRSTETINTPAGEQDVNYTSTFSPEGVYDIEIDHPINGTSEDTFFYEVGYYEPKYAIVLYEYDDNIGINPPVIGTPIFYRFKDDFSLLVTSTNANMSLPRKWTK